MFDFSKRTRIAAIASLALLFALAGCGGDVKDGAGAAPPASTTASVGVDGGTVNGPDGVQVVIPAGALDKQTEVGISNDGSGASEIGGIKPISKVVAVTPHGTEFAESVRISLPFSPADVAAGGQPVIIKSQPGGSWTALKSEVVGSMVSADISGFSYYAVGTCYTSADVFVPGPDPLVACPSAHSLKLELLDNSGVALPVQRGSNGVAIPVLTITEPAQLKIAFTYSRPPSGRLDHIFALASGAVTPPDWPRDKPFGGPTDIQILAGYQTVLTFDANPSTVPNASRPGGTVVRFRASVTTQMDAFYLGCLCFKPASWTYEAEVPVRVIFAAPITPPPPPVATYTVGGSVSGLTGAGLVLRNNGAGNLTVAASATSFAFAAPVNAGSAYNVTVFTQPVGQTCLVANGAGTANANVANVAVSCAVASAKAWQGAGLLETLDVGFSRDSQVVFDANGNGMLIWTQDDYTYSQVQSRRYTFSGGWGAVMPVSNGGAVYTRDSKIAADGLGNLRAVWTQPINPTTTSIWTNLYTAASGWGTATLLENNVSSSGGNKPEIAMDSAGNATVVWYAFDGTWTNLWAKRYAASGGWGAATLIENDNTGGAAGHRVVMDAGGNAMVVWVQTASIRFNRYVVGTGWGTATGVQGSSGVRNLDIAHDNAGSMLMAWAQHDGTTDSIYSSRLQSGTGLGWSTAALVETSSNWAGYSVSVAMDGNGNAIVVWYEVDNGDVTSIWARRYVAGVGGTAVRIDDSSSYTSGGFPQVSIDSAGNAMAVWRQNAETWANRYVAGSGWAGATLIESSTVVGGSPGAPQVAVDATGNAIAVWLRSSVGGDNIWGNVFR